MDTSGACISTLRDLVYSSVFSRLYTGRTLHSSRVRLKTCLRPGVLCILVCTNPLPVLRTCTVAHSTGKDTYQAGAPYCVSCPTSFTCYRLPNSNELTRSCRCYQLVYRQLAWYQADPFLCVRDRCRVTS